MDAPLGLTPGRGVQVLMRTYAFTRGLWQSLGDQETGAAAAIAHAVWLYHLCVRLARIDPLTAGE